MYEKIYIDIFIYMYIHITCIYYTYIDTCTCTHTHTLILYILMITQSEAGIFHNSGDPALLGFRLGALTVSGCDGRDVH